MAAEARELPRLNRLLYASGSLGGNVIARSKDLWLIYFYAPPADADVTPRIPILVLGLLFTVARLIEALDDPLIGWWSDRTRSRWGRRIRGGHPGGASARGCSACGSPRASYLGHRGSQSARAASPQPAALRLG